MPKGGDENLALRMNGNFDIKVNHRSIHAINRTGIERNTTKRPRRKAVVLK
jgi:hypothetical protein